MVSVTTVFTIRELKCLNEIVAEYPCISAKQKLVEALELAEIAEHAKGIQEESMR